MSSSRTRSHVSHGDALRAVHSTRTRAAGPLRAARTARGDHLERIVDFPGNQVAQTRTASTPPSLPEPQQGTPPGGVRRAAGSLRCTLAVGAGRSAAALSRRLGRGEGAIIGGRVTQALDPSALRRLSAGRRVVLVTGTNGKTTTSHLLAAALRAQSPVAHNATGANMADGALAALMAAPSAPAAVLEVDELNMAQVAAATSPTLIVLLNLSRDQLDRSTEVAAVAASIGRALTNHPNTAVVANCDDPVITALTIDRAEVTWVAAGARWMDDATLCPRCGRCPLSQHETEWWCQSCGLQRPRPDWWLSGGRAHGPDGRSVPLTVQLPGPYNVDNALTAVSAAEFLGLPPDRAAAAIAGVHSVAHRYAVVRRGGHRLTLLLAKNPAGWRATLPLAEGAAAVLLVVNAQEADGRDTSWLWDVSFEQLPAVPTVAAGQAAADLGLRLSYADIAHTTESDPLTALAALPDGEVTVIANYTAFTQLWHRLEGPA